MIKGYYSRYNLRNFAEHFSRFAGQLSEFAGCFRNFSIYKQKKIGLNEK